MNGKRAYRKDSDGKYGGDFKNGKKEWKSIYKYIKNNKKEDYEYDGEFKNNVRNGEHKKWKDRKEYGRLFFNGRRWKRKKELAGGANL